MTTAPEFERFMDGVRTRAAGALDAVIQNELYDVLNEFFQDTNCWREDIPFTATSDTTSYPVAPTGAAAIHRLMWVMDTQDYPVPAFMEELGTVDLVTAPATDTDYVATVALTVNDPIRRDGFPFFPMWVLNKFNSDIRAGVLARLMSQPAKPYTNEQLAIFHARQFVTAKSQARVEARTKNTYRGQAWAFPRGFAVRRKR